MAITGISGSGNRTGLPYPLPRFKPMTLADVQQELLEKTVMGRGSDATSVNVTNVTFRARLEKHLKDYESGHGDRSRATGAQLQSRHFANNMDLGSSDPVAARAYAAYSTTFQYSQNARFQTSVYEAAGGVRRIQSALDKEGDFKKYYDAIVKDVEARRVQGATSEVNVEAKTDVDIVA